MQMNASYTDARSLQELACGNEKAMRQLFAIYRNRLFFYITRITRSEQIAEELLMDVFMKIRLTYTFRLLKHSDNMNPASSYTIVEVWSARNFDATKHMAWPINPDEINRANGAYKQTPCW
jgi:hypothetical protein